MVFHANCPVGRRMFESVITISRSTVMRG
jgi:hypothetical protein